MNDDHRNDNADRLAELCADYALGLLDDAGLKELDALDPDHTARRDFEAAAAAIDLDHARSKPEEMPQGLLDKLFAGIPDAPANRPENPGGTGAAPIAARLAWIPWALAAASIALAAVVVLTSNPTPLPNPAQARQELIQQTDPDELLRYTWTATDDPAVEGPVTGDLVWDDATQRGYMKISGLAVNDPSRSQYQLWIFDATRPVGELPQFADESGGGLLSQRPVDGGVFNISDDGEVVIEIDPKLIVGQAAAFAITVEPPGGVVVSDRSRVPLLALASQS